jgi:hypothetical protein
MVVASINCACRLFCRGIKCLRGQACCLLKLPSCLAAACSLSFCCQVVGAVGFAGQRLALPPNLDSQVAGIINSCWASKPSDRPSFAQVLDKLRSFKDLPACPPPPPAAAAVAPADTSSGSLAVSARASSGGGAAASAAGSGGGAAGVSRQGSGSAAGSSGVQQQEQPLIML